MPRPQNASPGLCTPDGSAYGVAFCPMPTAAEDEVVDLCRDLIRIDTTNFSDSSGPGERAAAEYVAEKLTDVGLPAKIVESEPGRASVLSRVDGADSSRPPLLIHGHLDVVPAQKEDWQV